MAVVEKDSIEQVCEYVKDNLDSLVKDKDGNVLDLKKLTLLYASNASGKTRFSKWFHDSNEEQVLYYSAFTEDLFTWDNESFVLRIDTNTWIAKFIRDEGLYNQIIDKFKSLTGSNAEPEFALVPKKDQKGNKIPNDGEIQFKMSLGADGTRESIKISKGEEGVFIWSIFSTILSLGIETLKIEEVDNRSTAAFNDYKYILIDDPVSSMDDSRIIAIALDLLALIKKFPNNVKFLVTTHHALYFNVLFNSKMDNSFKKHFVLTKSGMKYLIKNQGTDSPFAYHHVVVDQILKAIQSQDVKKYHLNLFRGLLEKTANFLGYNQWDQCLEDKTNPDAFKKIIHHYSHDSLSELDYNELVEDEKNQFKSAFYFFLKKYDWGKKVNE